MTNTETHLVLAVRSGTVELVGEPFLSWSDAQNKWALLTDERLNQQTPATDLHYMVRSSDDPKYAHLLPRLYVNREAAAKALGRRAFPGQSSHWQHSKLAAALGVDHRGWWHTANAGLRLGYLGKLSDGRAYLTALASTLEPS